ncbi:MAG TPA: NnrS family protein [Gammaproteobacteria bacterium]|nr:NnrS family protein [Gammaproteobacteria bacterium]
MARALLLPYRLLFPLAALFALVAIPLWLVIRRMHPAITGIDWHGHEMLFGYALAVIAGFLATRATHAVSWVLAGTWLGARIAVATGSGPAALIAGISFPVVVFLVAAPPLIAGAKRRENRILPAILTALIAADAAWWAGKVWFGPAVQTHVLLAAIDLVALLLLLIGGRALRVAAGGHLERQGIARQDYMQGRYELPLAAFAGGAAIADAIALETAAGILCLGAAMLALARVLPWQLHRALSVPQLWALALGYLWLVPGLALKGIAQLVENLPVTGMLHGIGIGALGTLTLVMMARTATLRARRPITDFGDIGVAALLVSAAALSRLLASCIPAAQNQLLWLAAATWSGAFLILLVRLWRTALPDHSGETIEMDT